MLFGALNTQNFFTSSVLDWKFEHIEPITNSKNWSVWKESNLLPMRVTEFTAQRSPLSHHTERDSLSGVGPAILSSGGKSLLYFTVIKQTLFLRQLHGLSPFAAQLRDNPTSYVRFLSTFMSDLLTNVIRWPDFEPVACVPIVVNCINASLLIEIGSKGWFRPSNLRLTVARDTISPLRN